MDRELTDEHLREVARIYADAVSRNHRPNVAIAQVFDCPVKTAQRWVYIARLREIMPRHGRKGRADGAESASYRQARRDILPAAADRLDGQAAAHGEAIHDYTDLLRVWAEDSTRWNEGN